MGSLEKLVAADPDRFAGVSYREGDAAVLVHVAERIGAARLPSAVRVGAASLPVRSVPAQYSTATLKSVLARVPSAEPFHSAVGSGLSTWGIDVEHNRIAVGVLLAGDAIRSAAAQTFGPVVTVSQVGAIRGLSRGDDSPWFNGGGRLSSGSTECTGSWTIRTNAGNSYMMTAGHCFRSGSSVRMSSGGRQWVGTTMYRTFHSGGVDVELVGRNRYNDSVWGGSLSNQESKPVTGWSRTSVPGSSMCIDGGYTGEDCDTSITTTDICANIGYEYFVQRACHLDVAVSNSDRVIAVAGDSGGPVYRNDGRGGVTAYGVITAEAADGRAAYYTRIDPILARYRSTLVTR